MLLRLMVQKLFTHAKGGCCTENADSPMFQEVLLGGHLYLMVLKVTLLKSYCGPTTLGVFVEERFQLSSSLKALLLRGPVLRF